MSRRKKLMNGTPVLPPVSEESTPETLTPAERTARWKRRQKNLSPYPNAVRRIKIRKQLHKSNPIVIEQKRLRRNERDRISDKRRRALAKQHCGGSLPSSDQLEHSRQRGPDGRRW